jgi:hypothetical protein
VLDNPNADMSGADAALYNIIYVLLGGASHQYLYRNTSPVRGMDGKPRSGQIIGLRPHSTQEIKPIPVGGGQISRDSWIDGYAYTPLSGGYTQPVVNTDVATLRFHSINPLQPQLSVSPFAAAFLDANADSQLTQFPLDLMKNGIFLSTIFQLAEESKEWEDSEFEQTKSEVKQQYGGSAKYNPIVVRGGNKVETAFPDFRKLDFAKLGERPEVRLCVASRADIVYVGFTAGLGTSTYDNVKLARIGFVKDSVVSLVASHARTLTGVMRRENWMGHPFGNGTSEFTIECDLSGVTALKDEEIDQQKQMTMAYGAGIATKNEARRTFHLPEDEATGNEYKVALALPAYPNTTETA